MAQEYTTDVLALAELEEVDEMAEAVVSDPLAFVWNVPVN